MHLPKWVCLGVLLLGVVLVAGPAALAQINTADLSGQALDPQNLPVAGAKVTVKNLATGGTRTATTDDSGHYRMVGLPPGRYELTVEGGKGLSKLVNPEIILTIGQQAEFDAHLQLQTGAETVTVTEATAVIETARTAVAETVDKLRIDNLPINGRNYIDFTRTTSQATRNSAPFIGAAPDSGLNIGGQRARSNQVSVDGADYVDNSVNGIRSTVSQEAVQEFQLIIGNYMPEFGRATGGVINIVTRGGTNQVHGNVFGFLRHSSIQARNPFSFNVDPATGALTPVKQPFTRVQAGATIGGPIQKDKTFYFFSYETTRRQETGFSSIGQNNFGFLPPTAIPCIPVPLVMTPFQVGFYQAALGPFAAAGACTSNSTALALEGAALLTGGSSNVALNGDLNVGASKVADALGIPTSVVGSKFFPPLTAGLVPLPSSYVGLNALRGNFPVSEGTSLWSARLDHQWNSRNNSFVRANVSPSLITGIQVNGQTQSSGINAASRTSLQQSRDLAVVGQHVTSFSSTVFNEFRFQFARRGLHYGFAQFPGGANPAVDIFGVASFGREPFSTVDRIERRYQWSDNLSYLKGKHTFKFGFDYNLIQIRSNTDQVFQLDFGGLYRFNSQNVGAIPTTFSAAQSYGVGIPGFFLQGIGSSGRQFDNKPLAFFVQDSWKIHPRLTLNYGVRYDFEFSPLFTPGTAINAAAEAALGVVEGIPRDKNNWAPRFALAWDPKGNSKTVVRAGYGIFYDHPPLATPFLSATADGALSSQLTIGPGAPSSAPLTLGTLSVLNASNIFQGIFNQGAFTNFFYQAVSPNGQLNPQRFDPLRPDSFFVKQNFLSPTAGVPLTFLPFTFPVASNFVYGRAQQGNLTIERQLGHDYKFSVGYTYTHGLHLNRPRNINATDPKLLVQNFANALASGLSAVGGPLGVTVPVPSGAPPAGCPPGGINTSTGSLVVIAPGALAQGFAAPNCAGPPVGFIGTAAVFNFFRPSGPNPSFAVLGLPLSTLKTLAGLAGYAVGPSVPIPFSDVTQQESSGNSVYHGLTVSFSKRFSSHFEFLSSYTFSHTIDDSTDLESPLAPQDNRNPNRDRSNSAFDQRHRWVTSAVFQTPYKRSDEGWWRKSFADLTVAPIIEVSSGRPFNLLTGSDYNLDFASTTDRPSLTSTAVPRLTATSPFLPGVIFRVPDQCAVNIPGLTDRTGAGCTGNLGRNPFTRPGSFQIDLRISRKFFITENWNLEVIADGFNLLNRNNVADVNFLCDPGAGSPTCSAGQPTASFDPRQFQFALKISW